MTSSILECMLSPAKRNRYFFRKPQNLSISFVFLIYIHYLCTYENETPISVCNRKQKRDGCSTNRITLILTNFLIGVTKKKNISTMYEYEEEMEAILSEQPWGGEDMDIAFDDGICQELEHPNPRRYRLEEILEHDFGYLGQRYQQNVGTVFSSVKHLFFLIRNVREFEGRCIPIIAEKLFRYKQCKIPEPCLYTTQKIFKGMIKEIAIRKYTMGQLSHIQKTADQRTLMLYTYIQLYHKGMDKALKRKVFEKFRKGGDRQMLFVVSSIIFNNPLFCCGHNYFTSIIATHIINGREDCIPFILIADYWQHKRGIHIKWTSNKGRNYYNDMLEIMSRPGYHYSKEMQALLSSVWSQWDWNPASYRFSPQNREKKVSYIAQELSSLHQEINEVRENFEQADKLNKKEHESLGADIKQVKEKPANVTNNYFAPVGQSIGNANINNKQVDNGKSEPKQL